MKPDNIAALLQKYEADLNKLRRDLDGMKALVKPAHVIFIKEDSLPAADMYGQATVYKQGIYGAAGWTRFVESPL